jgi:hypothetical protein
MKKIIVIFLLLIPFYSKGQTITVFAGNGHNATTGDGHAATAAGVPDPIGGVFDKQGNYYFADLGSRTVRKIDTNGIITTVAGNGLGGSSGDGGFATAARLNAPDDVKLDSTGNLYIADNGNDNIRKVNIATGIISTIAGVTGTGAFGGDGGPATAATIWGPEGLCFDKYGNLYIADAFNYRVRKVDPSGIITTFAGTGAMSFSGDGFPATAAGVYFPISVIADDTGNIYIAEEIGNHVRKVNISGIISTFAGNGTGTYSGDGIPATNAQINPCALNIDSFSNLYIADKYNYRIYKIDGAGIIHSIAGTGTGGFGGMGGPATAAPLDFPSGVALDACNNLYIPLADSNRILKVTFDSTCDPYHAGPLEITEISSTVISIYPNPASSTITITSPNKLSQITISNLIGQTKYSQVYEAEKVEINIANLPSGIYMVAIIDEEGNKTVKKIVKE